MLKQYFLKKGKKEMTALLFSEAIAVEKEKLNQSTIFPKIAFF
jgi:hypothetical protein